VAISSTATVSFSIGCVIRREMRNVNRMATSVATGKREHEALVDAAIFAKTAALVGASSGGRNVNDGNGSAGSIANRRRPDLHNDALESSIVPPRDRHAVLVGADFSTPQVARGWR